MEIANGYFSKVYMSYTNMATIIEAVLWDHDLVMSTIILTIILGHRGQNVKEIHYSKNQVSLTFIKGTTEFDIVILS